MRVARTWRLSLLSAGAVLAAQLTPFAVAHAEMTPTVSVTSPAVSDPEEGPGTVTGLAHVDPTLDTATSMQLLVDGSPAGAAVNCTGGVGADCSASVVYDFSGKSGGHTVAWQVITADFPAGVTSAAVGVNVSTVAPTVAVTSPASGATATGPTTITATGTVDSHQTDYPVTMVLTVGSATPMTYTCPGDLADRVCHASWSFDFTDYTGSQQVTVHMQTSTSSADSFAPYSVNPGHPAPVVTITSPAAGSTQAGTVTVVTTSTVDSTLTDHPNTMQLYVDGVAQGTAFQCVTSGKTCNPTFTYDGTGRTDTATLQVKLTTTKSVTQNSAQVAVNMTSPPPTVSITSPSPGAAVSGIVHVGVSAAVGTGQTDTGKSVQLVLDPATTNLAIGTPTACPSATTCVKTLDWNSSGYAGTHTLSVKFITTALKTPLVDPTVNVVVSSPAPSALVQSPTAGSAVTGPTTVTALGTIDPSQSDTPLTLQLFVDGAASGPAVACGASSDPRACPATLSWDPTGLVGTHSVAVKFTTSANSAISPSVSVIVHSPAPVITVTSPAASATVSGVVTVSSTATIDASQTDTPRSLQLYVDGIASGVASTCPTGGATPKVCSLGASWDTTGLSGTHVLQMRILTTKGISALSPGVSVTVVNPLPSVAITSPTVDSSVSGVVTVTASGAVDAGQSDTAGSMALAVDGAPLGFAQTCSSADPKACAASFSWATSGLAGAHTLAVTFTSARGAVSVATERVYVLSGTVLKLSPIATLPYGHTATVKGTVTATANGKGINGLVVHVTLTPAVGSAHLLTVRTDGLGRFSLTYKVAANTKVSATVVTPAYYGPAGASGKIVVTAGVSCAAKVSATHGVALKGTCKVPNLLKGTKVTLQYKAGSRWITAGSAKATAGLVTYTAKFAKPGSYSVRLVVAGSRVFAASVGASSKWVVR